MTGVLAYLALTVTLPAMLLGHQGQDWPLAGAWRWLRGSLAASRAARALGEQPERYRPPQRPSWAAGEVTRQLTP